MSVASRLLSSLCALCVTAVTLQAQPASRQSLNLHGRLTDNTGACLTGPYAFQIDIFNVSSGGATLYTDTQAAVQVTNGIYDITIGAGTGGPVPTTVFNGCPDLWIEIIVNGETLSPRTHLTSVAYAFCANLLDGIDSTAFIGPSGGSITGPLDASVPVPAAGGAAMTFDQTSADAATGPRATLFLNTSGTDANNDALIAGSNDGGSTLVFTVNRDGALAATSLKAPVLTSGAGNLTLDAGGASNLTLQTGSTDRLVIDGSGRVGIGTSTPTKALHVVTQSGGVAEFDAYGAAPIIAMRHANGTIAVPTGMLLNDNLGTFSMSGYATTGFVGPGKASLKGIAAENWTDAAQGAHIVLSTTPIGTATSAERVRITDAGDVGIGTTTPGSKLDVVGASTASVGTFQVSSPTTLLTGDYSTLEALNTNTTSNNFSGLGFTTLDTLSVKYGGASIQGVFTSHAAGAISADLVFGTANASTSVAERMRILSNGKVGIGTTTPTSTLHVVGTSGAVVEFDTYGVSPIVKMRRANGTPGAPTGILINENLGTFSMSGYGATGFGNPGKASLKGIAAENWTDAAQGAHIALATTPIGSTASTERVRITAAGDVGIGTTTPGGSLTVASGRGQFTSNTVPSSGTGVEIGYDGLNDWGVIDSYARGVGQKPLHLQNDAMVILDTGNVGIGTNTPAQRLDVNGNANISGNLVVTGTISQTAGGGDFVKKAGDTMSGALQIDAALLAGGSTGVDAFAIDSDNTASDTINISTEPAGAADTIAIGSNSDTVLIDTAGAGTTLQISNDGNVDTINLGGPGDDLSIAATLRNASPLIFDGATAGGGTTTLSIVDPNAARTITFPNASGTVSVGSSGTFTWSTATPSFSVANGLVTAGSQVLVFPTNAVAATMVGSSSSPYVSSITPGASFTLTTGDSAAAAGSETFHYIIINP
ncbi:MAG: hypothetical protein HYY93_00985 [Planctomycetes bacterium]|nr:hypothetical protein [Planctomycetota bacterium]